MYWTILTYNNDALLMMEVGEHRTVYSAPFQLEEIAKTEA